MGCSGNSVRASVGKGEVYDVGKGEGMLVGKCVDMKIQNET